MFRSERKKRSTYGGSPRFSNGISGKLLFHLTFNRNFRIFWINGKHPKCPFREQASLTYLYVPTSFGVFPGGLNSSFTPFSASDLKIATLPLDSKTAMSLQLGNGAKLTQVAGDGSSTACADIGGGTTICFIGVNSNLAGNKNKNCKIISLEYGIHLKPGTTGR